MVDIEQKFILLCERHICPTMLLGIFYDYADMAIQRSQGLHDEYHDPAIYNTLEGIADWYLGLFGVADIKWAIEYLISKHYVKVIDVLIDQQKMLSIEANIEIIEADSKDLKLSPRLIHAPKYALQQARKKAEERKHWRPATAEELYETSIDEEEARRVKSHNSRAKKVHLPATLTLEQWLETLDHFDWKCAYCSGKYKALEHFIPLNHGGGTTWDNCIPACSKCNVLKQAWNPLSEWGPDLTTIKDGIERVQAYLATRKPV